MKNSLAVIPVKGKVLKFVAWIDHPDADVKPVHAQVWADSKLVYEGDLQARAADPRHSGDAGQDVHAPRDVDRSDVAPERFRQPRSAASSGLSIRDWVWE